MSVRSCPQVPAPRPLFPRISRLLIFALLTGPAASASRLGNLSSLGPGGGGATVSAAFHNSNPDIILVGQDVGGIYKSTDGGKSWRHVNDSGLSLPEISLNVYFVEELVARPGYDNTFFACTQSGLFRSTDIGETWSRVLPVEDPENAEIPVSWIAFSPLDPNLALVGTGSWHEPDEGFGIYRSRDGGQSFSKVPSSGIPPQAVITSIAFHPQNGSAWASTTQGLFRSLDDGDSFAKVPFQFRHERGQRVAVGVKEGQATFWYLLQTLGEDGDPDSRSSGIYRSQDGLDWTGIQGVPAVNDAESNELMRNMGGRLAPDDPEVLYLNLRTDGGEGGLYRYDGAWESLIGGLENPTWASGAGLFGIAPESLAISPSDPNLIISCNEIALLISRDRGANWTQASSINVGSGLWSGTGAEVTAVYDVKMSRGRLYAAFEDIGLWRSDDWGGSWRQLAWPGAAPDTVRPDGATEVCVHPDDPDRFYAALGSFSNGLREPEVRSEIHKSLDGGATLREITPDAPPGDLGRPAVAVAWGPTPEADVVLAAFHGDTLYRSLDGGETWAESSAGIAAPDKQVIYRIAVDPSNPQVVYAGLMPFFQSFPSLGGLYRSNDGGASWVKVTGYPYQDVHTIKLLQGRLFVGGWTGSQGALLRSADGTDFSQALDQPFVYDVIAAPGRKDVFYASAGGSFVVAESQQAGIYESEDGGLSWTRMKGDLQHNRIFALAASEDQPRILFMASDGAGIISGQVDGFDRHFAQFGDGPGLTSSVLLLNPSPQQIEGRARLIASDGTLLLAGINGMTPSSEFSFSIRPGGLGLFSSDGADGDLRVGSVLSTANGTLGGAILFSGEFGLAGVGASDTLGAAIIPIESDALRGVRTGVAMFNPNPNTVAATLVLRAPDGSEVAGGRQVIAIEAANQISRFPDELFAGSPVDLSDFTGSLHLTASHPIVSMAIRLSPEQFATLPVTPMGFGARRWHFAQFGSGPGLKSTLILVNPLARAVSGTVLLFAADGGSLTTVINGILRNGAFDFEVPGMGTVFLTAQDSGILQTGSAQLEADGFLGSTVLFQSPSGIAGVSATMPQLASSVPIVSRSEEGFRTGVALANPQGAPVSIRIVLRNESGEALPEADLIVNMGAHAQTARFPEEFFAEAGIDFSRFTGVMEIRATAPIVAMAIGVGPGEFATLPVTPLLSGRVH